MSDTYPIGRLVNRTLVAIKGLFPGYFALVMATGIVSTGLFLQGYRDLSDWLLWINLTAYPWLIVATGIRAVKYTAELWASLTNPQTVFSFHTFVAATNVLGVQLFVRGHHTAALGFWCTGFLAWLSLGYFAFSVLMFSNDGGLAESVNATWLIAIVATQSVTVLGSYLAPEMGRQAPLLSLLAYCTWGIGTAFYGILISFVLYRLFFAPVCPGDMSPPYWIILGATAISTLAGSSLLGLVPSEPFLARLRPFVEGLTLLLWAWSTWWMPMLVILGVWRHIVKKVRVTYNPAYWSLVFPLGMYTVATHRISAVMQLSALRTLSSVMIWVALIAWCLAMYGLVRTLLGSAIAECRQTIRIVQPSGAGVEKP